jgi:hypothetical protein
MVCIYNKYLILKRVIRGFVYRGQLWYTHLYCIYMQRDSKFVKAHGEETCEQAVWPAEEVGVLGLCPEGYAHPTHRFIVAAQDMKYTARGCTTTAESESVV